MQHNYTIVWRPGEADHFRVDQLHIVKPGRDINQQLILRFAAQKYLGDMTGVYPRTCDEPEVLSLLDEPYDLIAIFEGYQTDIHRE